MSMSTQMQPQQPVVVYPNTVSGQPPAMTHSHSNGSFGTVFIVLAVIIVISAIACCLGRLCNKRQGNKHGNKQQNPNNNKQSHHQNPNLNPNFRMKERGREREDDLEFGFEKGFPTSRPAGINGDGRENHKATFPENNINGHHVKFADVDGANLKHPGP